jgi:hypothetical protein
MAMSKDKNSKKDDDKKDGQGKILKKYVVPALIVYGSITHLGIDAIATSPSSRKLKKDITPLSMDDCSDILSRLRRARIYRFRYKAERGTSKPHLGVIAEEAPEEIVDEGRENVRLGATMGFMMAAIKALAAQQQTLLNDLKKKRPIKRAPDR